MTNIIRPLNIAWISFAALGAGAVGYATYLRNASVVDVEAALSQAQVLDVAGWVALALALVLGILALVISHDGREGVAAEESAEAAVPTAAPAAVTAVPAEAQLDVSPAPAAA